MRKIITQLVIALLLLPPSFPGWADTMQIERVAKNRGKPTAPVTINFIGAKEYLSGQSINMVVQVTPRSEVEKITISLRPTNGLTLIGDNEHLVQQPTRGKIVEIPVSLVANVDGQHRLRVVVQTQHQGKIRAKALGVNIVVGAVVESRKPSALVTTPNGELLHELRVFEDVNPEL